MLIFVLWVQSVVSTPEASFSFAPNVKISMMIELKSRSRAKEVSVLADGIGSKQSFVFST